MKPKVSDIDDYNNSLIGETKNMCQLLRQEIDKSLSNATSTIWHGHPVWFLNGNPIVGYSQLKDCVQLLFWSGQSFDEPGLLSEGTFKAAQARYTSLDMIDTKDLKRWLKKAQLIQWDYKNIVKKRGQLDRLP